MSNPVEPLCRVHGLFDRPGATEPELACMIAVALAEARFAAAGLREAIIPILEPSRLTFLEQVARCLDDGWIFDETVIEDLNMLLEILAMKIAADTHVGWEADDHHVMGGYEVVYAGDEARSFSRCAAEVRKARDAASAVLFAVRAGRLAIELLKT